MRHDTKVIEYILSSMDIEEIKLKLQVLKYHIDYIERNSTDFDSKIFNNLKDIQYILIDAISIIMAYDKKSMSNKITEMSIPGMQGREEVRKPNKKRSRTYLSLVY
jgi:hypothetical protein